MDDQPANFVTNAAQPVSVGPTNWWNGTGISLASMAVDISKLDKSLADFLSSAAKVHQFLFGSPMIVTSGNDGNHVTHSAHYLNFAADIRSRDLDPEGQIIFGALLCYIASKYKICVFDERATPGQHWHVQTAASAGA